MESKKTNSVWIKNLLPTFFIWFLVVGIFQVIAALLVGYDIMNQDRVHFEETPFQQFFMMLSTLLGTLFVVILCRRGIEKKSFLSLGFNIRFLVHDTLWGLLLGAGMMVFGFLLVLMLDNVSVIYGGFEWRPFLLSVGIYVCVAWAEELFCRGTVLGNMLLSFNKYIAILFSAAIFSLMHIVNSHVSFIGLLSIFISGILLGSGYILSRNIWFPVALHFSWNFVQGTVLGFNVSGNTGYSVMRLTIAEGSLLNGSGFGFEGSVLCIGLGLLMIPLVWLVFRHRKDVADLIPPQP
ncbi:MAG: family intrarane metalloprotease [Bacteroidetes bacterium]|nr:family intrarane metalloprotease [Bacteroidota bacterium]